MLPEAEQRDAEKDEGGQREGDDDVARHGEGVGHHAEHVQRQHEHEQREHEREIFHPVGADIVAHHVGDELVGNLGDRLQPRRHQRAAVHGVNCEECDEGGGDQHEQRRVGEGRVEAEQLEGDEPLDLELVHGIGQAAGGAATVPLPLPRRMLRRSLQTVPSRRHRPTRSASLLPIAPPPACAWRCAPHS